MKIEARFSHDKVKFDQENNVHLVVSLKAPKTEWQKKRPPVCIIPVIDLSGSMQGEKLDFAKKSVMKLIDHLQPGDYCGLVTFSDTAETIFKPMEITQSKKEQLRAKVQELQVQGWTNLAGGMSEGLEHANKTDLPEGCLLRVILLTDGLPNRGLATDASSLLKLLSANLGVATLSAFGYGADANQEMLSSMAKVGKGNYAFIQNPDDALAAFAKELGGLLSTYAQNIVVEVEANNGHVIEEVLSDVDVEQKDKKVTIKLPEILSEEERHLVLKMKLSEQTQALPRAMSVADVKVSYDFLEDNGKKATKTEELKAKIQFVKEGEEQDKPTPEVDKIIGLAEIVKVQAQAEAYAARGEYNTAGEILGKAEGRMRKRGLVAHAVALRGLQPRMASASMYAASDGYRNSLRNAGTRATGTSGMDAEAGAVYASMGFCASNSAQDDMVKNFNGDPGVHQGVHGIAGVGVGNPVGAGIGASIHVDPGGGVHVQATPGGSIKISATPSDKKKAKSLSKKRSTSRW